MSRWSNWSRGSNPSKMLSDFLKEGPVDPGRTGNPTGTGQLSPADRARQLGLQSNGKGGYIDPKTQQVVARTVNNELVFYSSAPGGGAVSDGSGGQAAANPTSAWQDPISGLMVTPPGQPESPGEIAAVPDPVPAQAPAGYYAFMQQKKQDMYVQDKQARDMPPPPPQLDPDAEMPADPAMQEPTAVPGMAENYLPNDLLGRTGGLGPPPFQVLRDRLKSAKTNADVASVGQRGQQMMGGQGGNVDAALNKVPNLTGKPEAKATKGNITKYDNYINKARQAVDANYADSEAQFDDPAAEQQRRYDLEAGGLPDDEFMQNAIGLNQAMAKQRAERVARQEAELGFVDNRVNSGRHLHSSGVFDPDMPGVGDKLEESAALEAVKMMLSDGVIDRNEADLIDRLAAYGMDPKGVEGKNARKWFDTSVKTAQAIRQHLGIEPGAKNDEYSYGKFGGQNTAIPDEQRSNVYDDILEDMQFMVGLDSPEFKAQSRTVQERQKETYKQYKEEMQKYLAGEIDEKPDLDKPPYKGALKGKLIKFGKSNIMKSKGFEADDPDDKVNSQFKDQLQAGDIYVVRRAMEQEIRNKFQELYEKFGDQPKIYNQLARHALQKYQEQKDLVSYSLKQVPEDRDAHFSPYNVAMEDLARRVADGGDLSSQISFNFGGGDNFLRLSPQDANITSASYPFQTTGRYNDDLEDDTPTGAKGDIGGSAKFWPVRSQKGGDEFKMEPIPEDSAARAGVFSKQKFLNRARDILGFGINDMLPKTGKKGSETVPGDMTDEQKDFWRQQMKEYMEFSDGLPDGHYLKLNPEQFNYGDQANMGGSAWMEQALNDYNLTDEEREAGNFDDNNVQRDAGQFNPRLSKANINFALRNLLFMKMFKNMHEQGKDKDLFEELMFGSSKINYNDDDEFLPYVKIY